MDEDGKGQKLSGQQQRVLKLLFSRQKTPDFSQVMNGATE